MIRGKQIDALVGDQTYTLGQLPLLKRIDWWVSSQLPDYTLLRLVVMGLLWLVGIAVALAVLRSLLRRLRKKDA
ncbi:hypothetical protein ACOTCQ_29160 [Achromobacter dolens]|uniref:hypothetical protein n=1 Tax=Achromobacter dolens TaxID=1287738 RepID=UPI003B9D50CB